jgi:hypothetical protein
MLPRILSAALLCGLAGCASHPGRTLVPLVALDPARCAPSISLASWTPIVLGEAETDKNEVMLDETSPCVVRQDGSAAAYHLFRLPADDRPYLVTIRTAPVGPAYLVVNADILAENGAVLRTIGPEGFSFHGTSLMALLRNRPGEVYVAVRSDPGRVGQAFDQISEFGGVSSTTTVTTVGKGGKVTGSYTSTYGVPGASLNHNFVFSHNGSLHVTATMILAN